MIVRFYVYISDIVIGMGIVDCVRSRSQTVVRGRLATSCCRRERLPPDGWWPLAVAGGGGGLVSWACILRESRRVFSMR